MTYMRSIYDDMFCGSAEEISGIVPWGLAPNAFDPIYAAIGMAGAKAAGVHVDHIYPKSRGGLHVPENLRVIAAGANIKKGTKVTKAALALHKSLLRKYGQRLYLEYWQNFPEWCAYAMKCGIISDGSLR